ncbi:MAG TPA: hypothetical protein VL986_05685 [Terracidiphilus sp.]|nr:hypothetical protein [Terracidiphilus sp.]
MSTDSNRDCRFLPAALGIITLAGVALLFVWDAWPKLFPARSHDYLAAFSLAMIALAFVVFRLVQRASLVDLAKALVLAAAFLFWAANQFWPNSPRATLFNDIAIGLFVLDVFFVIAARPADKQIEQVREPL